MLKKDPLLLVELIVMKLPSIKQGKGRKRGKKEEGMK